LIRKTPDLDLFFIYDSVLRRLMLGLRFVPTVFKTGKLDMCEDISLMMVALNYDLRLRLIRCVEHHHLLCVYDRRKCVKTPCWTRLTGVGGLKLVATSYNTTNV
jgi:hypothetical protein